MENTTLDPIAESLDRRDVLASGEATALLEAPTGHAWAGLPHAVGILGTGLYVPRRVVTNEELTRSLDTSEEWIVTRTGIRERRYVEEGEATSDMCIAAARQALENSGVEAADVDAIIVTTFTPDQPLPSTALMVKDTLGAHRAFPLDLTQAACAGGIYALVTAAHLLQSEAFRNVLVIGGDELPRVSRTVDNELIYAAGCRSWNS